MTKMNRNIRKRKQHDKQIVETRISRRGDVAQQILLSNNELFLHENQIDFSSFYSFLFLEISTEIFFSFCKKFPRIKNSISDGKQLKIFFSSVFKKKKVFIFGHESKDLRKRKSFEKWKSNN